MNKSRYTFLFLLLLLFCPGLSAQEVKTVSSPDGKLQLTITLTKEGQMSYAFKADNREFIQSSSLGYVADTDRTLPAAGWVLTETARNSVRSVWKPVWGKREAVPEQYNEMILHLSGPDSVVLRVTARAYNDGAAFRYAFPSVPDAGLNASAELTQYCFAGDYTAWFYNGEHENIGPEKLSETSGQRMPVMTIRAGQDAFLAIHEADLTNGDPLMLDSKEKSTAFSVVSVPGKLDAGYRSAWRVILFGKTPGELVDSHLIELLNPEPRGDFSWVKPGVAVWDWRIDGAVVDGFTYGMNYPSWVRMVDFAAENNIRYLVLDANWYGPESESTSDPVKGDKAADVMRIIQYGKTKGVGLWLYLNDVGGREYPIEQTLKQYRDWGAAGIKYGFMSGTPVEKNAWTRRITQLCAENQLLCDFHDGPVHPYGQIRTWPNAVTREYCHAQLDAHRVFVPKTFVTTVFVNMLAGPIDMNNGMFDLRQGKTTRVDENQPVPSTVVSEAARTLIVFSGATIIPDVPEFYHKYPDLLRFIAAQKMPWKESKTLAGEIGEYIVMARQASDGTWLAGAATNEQPRELDIPLSFLGKGKYDVTIIQDGANSHYLTNREELVTGNKVLKAGDRVHVKLAAGGGACLIIKRID
ncbi:MAG: glycoside hydrolase family 97 N-terminal domain-containing protein [Mangrovibacterium sp.]